MRNKYSNNLRNLRTIISKIRQIRITPDISYMVAYTFLYKYCSDSLKEYLLMLIEDKAITLDEAYSDEKCLKMFKSQSIQKHGFFINSPDCFFDEVINRSFSENYFVYTFFKSFSGSIEFGEKSNYEKYFHFIFDALKDVVNFNKYEFEAENHLNVKDIVYAISKMDVFEREYPFEKVFDRLCESRLFRIDTDPDYITSILSSLIAESRYSIGDIYNPFLNDASALIDLSYRYNAGFRHIYARSHDRLTYCTNIVKFTIGYYDMDRVFLELGSPFEAMNISGKSFDVITARIPPITNKNFQRLSRAQSMEIAKQNKRKELQSLLADKFNIDEESFSNDSELNSTIESLVDKIDLEAESKVQFRGEYASLQDNEYLFLINLINSLNDDGIMAVAMSQSILFKNTLRTLRKYLTHEKNYIDAIINIPNELSRRKSSDIVVIFKKDRVSDDILFIDMSTDYNLKKERYTVPGLFKRNLTFDLESLKYLVDVYKKREIVDKYSSIVSMPEICKNDFNLSISRYVDTFEGEFIRLEDLKNEKKEITLNIKKLNLKIDRMMDELNLRK